MFSSLAEAAAEAETWPEAAAQARSYFIQGTGLARAHTLWRSARVVWGQETYLMDTLARGAKALQAALVACLWQQAEVEAALGVGVPTLPLATEQLAAAAVEQAAFTMARLLLVGPLG